MTIDTLRLFALTASRGFGERVSTCLGKPLDEHEEREFEDGEHKARPLTNVRGTDAFVIHSLYSDAQQTANDKLVRLAFFVGALKDASAETVTAVVPYLCYARKDRKTKPRDPVNTRYVASLLESVGVDRVVTMDVHNLAAYQNAFRCHTDHLEANKLFIDHFAPRIADQAPVVVSPDIGGIKRAELFRAALSRRLDRDVGSAFMEKHRSAGVVSGETMVGELEGKTAIILDDLIAGGTTIARTAKACHLRGAAHIYAAATHGLFVGDANDNIAHPEISELVIMNTVEPYRLTSPAAREKLVVLDAAPMFAEAIRCIHSGDSIVELLTV